MSGRARQEIELLTDGKDPQHFVGVVIDGHEIPVSSVDLHWSAALGVTEVKFTVFTRKVSITGPAPARPESAP